MRIGFCDFVPARVQTGVFSVDVESVEVVVVRANDWIEANRIDVINVETVQLPGRRARSEDGEHLESSDSSTSWVSVVRVWFRQPG